jgi:renalase
MSNNQGPILSGHVGVLVVGGGVAGLTAARFLGAAGHDVLVVDKGWNPGGRLATRVTDRARFDHGATFFAATEKRFNADLESWRQAEFACPWEGLESSESHWRGTPDMRSLGSHLAHGLTVATRTRLTAVKRDGDLWVALGEGGQRVTAEAVLMTPPVPQTLALLDAGEVNLEPNLRDKLERVSYERCFVVMATLDRPARVPAPGMIVPTEGPIARIVDEQAKGVSKVPAVTLHASAEFSRSRWDADRDTVAAEILRAAEPWLDGGVADFQIHGWRYSRPVTTWPEPCLIAATDPYLILAGDAFGGPDVSGAYRSGLAAAEALIARASG